jgi:hypothetical protein
LNQSDLTALAQLQIDTAICTALAGFFHDIALPPKRLADQPFE